MIEHALAQLELIAYVLSLLGPKEQMLQLFLFGRGELSERPIRHEDVLIVHDGDDDGVSPLVAPGPGTCHTAYGALYQDAHLSLPKVNNNGSESVMATVFS